MKTFKDLNFTKKDWCDGRQAALDFDNGYGVSVIDGYGAYCNEGTFEIAVTHNDRLCYATSITSDVIGHQRPRQITTILKKIQGLPKNNKCTHARTESE